jgi:hypothetical protein
MVLREELQKKFQSPRLFDRMRDTMRAHHYSPSTEKSYAAWAQRFILFHKKRHPMDMGEARSMPFLHTWR